jgi:hypothetical protein
MKKLVLGMFLASGAMAVDTQSLIQTALHVDTLGTVRTLSDGLIDWKVGESTTMNLQIGFPIPMRMVKSVTKEEMVDGSAAVWIKQEVKGFIPQTVEILIRRADGQILKMIQNGQQVEPPSNDNVEIISQDVDTVTVPAGTFKTLKIVGKQGDSDFTIWLNPREIPVGGEAKMDITQQGQNVKGELASFVKK